MYIIVNIFGCLIRGSTASPTLPHVRTSLLAPLYHGRQLSGWLWCQIIKRRPPKANSPPITLFLMGYVSAPQAKEQAAANVNPPPGACNGLAGSLSAFICWGHGGCCHGDRRQSRWRVGQWRLMLCVLCFVFCVLFVVLCLLAYLFYNFLFLGQRTNKQTLCSCK